VDTEQKPVENTASIERTICLDFYCNRPESKNQLVKKRAYFLVLSSVLMILGSQDHRVAKKMCWI